MNNEYRYCV